MSAHYVGWTVWRLGLTGQLASATLHRGAHSGKAQKLSLHVTLHVSTFATILNAVILLFRIFLFLKVRLSHPLWCCWPGEGCEKSSFSCCWDLVRFRSSTKVVQDISIFWYFLGDSITGNNHPPHATEGTCSITSQEITTSLYKGTEKATSAKRLIFCRIGDNCRPLSVQQCIVASRCIRHDVSHDQRQSAAIRGA